MDESRPHKSLTPLSAGRNLQIGWHNILCRCYQERGGARQPGVPGVRRNRAGGSRGRPGTVLGGTCAGGIVAMKTAVQIDRAKAPGISFQEASIDIWDKKYRLKSKTGEVIDETMDDTYQAHRPGSCRGRAGGGAGALVRDVSVGAAAGRHSGRPHRFQCRRPGTQARHLDDQLHGVRAPSPTRCTRFSRRCMRPG